MGIGTSILLIAIGAILRFAVHVSTSGFSIHTAGVILMVIGVVGLLISLLYSAVWADRRRGTVPPADPAAGVGERRVVREREVV